MKKKLSLILVLIFLCTIVFQQNTFASINELNFEADKFITKDDSEKLNEVLNIADIHINSENIVDVEEVFSESQIKSLLQDTLNQDEDESANGLTRIASIVVKPIIKEKGLSYSWVDIVDTYTGKEEILNSSSRGMAYWLDVTWNLVIGNTTKYFWQASTILGLNPSNFMSNYKSGDKLSSTKTKVITRRIYKKYHPVMNLEMFYVETKKQVVKNYVDLYTFDKYNNSVRVSQTDTQTFYTEHYFDPTWITDKVNSAWQANLQVQYYDQYNGQITVPGATWQFLEGNWYWYENGVPIKSAWRQINGYWYYFKSDGVVATNWLQLSGKWYYFWDGGSMATGWLQKGAYWYYLDPTNGDMKTSWQQISGTWYYFYSSGEMATNVTIDGWWIDGNGVAHQP
ncbi:hypothetical protein [Clostridium sp.]|uniref:hypothetical protein n=1 Tax=Clostridium sp. TaxID=1506 RepID=UPI002624B4C2|nr:hypothetical protein [Clostridium sp.]